MPAKKTQNEKQQNEICFEKALERLNEIADILENKTPSLEQALSLYEEGSKLLKQSMEKLKKAEAKITLLTKQENL